MAFDLPALNQYLRVIMEKVGAPGMVVQIAEDGTQRTVDAALTCPLSSVLCPLSSVLCPLSSVLCPLIYCRLNTGH